MSRLQESLAPGGSRHPVLRGALAGAGLGVLWGIGARVFMRLVSTDPSFSWAGTAFIVGLAGLLGTGLGMVAAAQAVGARRWWLLAVLPGLMLLAGPGVPFVPAFAIGGLAFSRRHLALRVLGALAIVVPAVVLWWVTRLDEETMLAMPTHLQVRGVVGFTILSVALAAGSSVLWRRWAPRAAGAQEQVPLPASSGLLAPAAPTSAHS